MVVLLDSRVRVGAIHIGCSSSKQLTAELRRLSAARVGARVQLRARWIGTKFNLADAP